MKENIYITISEFGDIHFHKGDIPPEFLSASDDGIYDLIDITNPQIPLRHWEGEWVILEALPLE